MFFFIHLKVYSYNLAVWRCQLDAVQGLKNVDDSVHCLLLNNFALLVSGEEKPRVKASGARFGC